MVYKFLQDIECKLSLFAAPKFIKGSDILFVFPDMVRERDFRIWKIKRYFSFFVKPQLFFYTLKGKVKNMSLVLMLSIFSQHKFILGLVRFLYDFFRYDYWYSTSDGTLLAVSKPLYGFFRKMLNVNSNLLIRLLITMEPGLNYSQAVWCLWNSFK